ncbi:MAG: hypothetical protein JRI59_04475 [Deltaproteobacteria bacterium]|nr:hypothetical protein [Deltaproteobacteria bacterium]
MKTRCLITAAALGTLLLGLLLWGCGESRAPFAGTYQSVQPFGKSYVKLVLKANGEGSWTYEGEAVKFKWRVDKGRIWIYTREGGIIIVTPTEQGKYLSADMSGEWHPSCPREKCLTFRRVEPGG